jgi:hypothetical protein
MRPTSAAASSKLQVTCGDTPSVIETSHGVSHWMARRSGSMTSSIRAISRASACS